MNKREIRFIVCKTREEELEIIKLLKKKYKYERYCEFREVSETFILPDKKWIIASEHLTKILTKRQPNIKIYKSELIKETINKGDELN